MKRLPSHRYDVALWLNWPSAMPNYFADKLVASSAFNAIERLMRRHGLQQVAYASVRQRRGGFLIYRCHKITVCEMKP